MPDELDAADRSADDVDLRNVATHSTMTVVPNPPYPDGPPPVLPDPDPVPRPITPEPRPDEPPDPDQPPVLPDPVV